MFVPSCVFALSKSCFLISSTASSSTSIDVVGVSKIVSGSVEFILRDSITSP